MNIFKSTFIAAGLLAAGSMGAQAETIIDLFETPQTTLSVCITGNPTCNNGVAATPFAESRVSTVGDDIVGLERDMFIQATGTGPNDTQGATSTIGVFQSGADGGISCSAPKNN